MRQRRLKNEINVVPYIDVMLVLLVIFMVTTPMMTTGSRSICPSVGQGNRKSRQAAGSSNQGGSEPVGDRPAGNSKVKGSKQPARTRIAAAQGRSSNDNPDQPVLIAGDKETSSTRTSLEVHGRTAARPASSASACWCKPAAGK
jgi:biopolymer transport protein TolR